MKNRAAYSILSIGILSLIALTCSPWVIGQETGGGGAGGAVNKDPFVKKPAAGAAADDPFGGGGGGTPAVDDPFGGSADDVATDDPFGAGGKPQPKKPKEVVEAGALLEYIQTDLTTANELLREFRATEDVTALREKFEGMIEAGEAELVETCFLRAMPGQRMKTESVRDHIYAKEFNPPEIPQQFVGKSTPPPISSATPGGFLIRGIGTTVEIEMTVSPGEPGKRYIDVNIAPEIVKNLGDRPLARDGTPEYRIETQPDFSTMRLTTGLTMKEGTKSTVTRTSFWPSLLMRRFRPTPTLVMQTAGRLWGHCLEKRGHFQSELPVRRLFKGPYGRLIKQNLLRLGEGSFVFA